MIGVINSEQKYYMNDQHLILINTKPHSYQILHFWDEPNPKKGKKKSRKFSHRDLKFPHFNIYSVFIDYVHHTDKTKGLTFYFPLYAFFLI